MGLIYHFLGPSGATKEGIVKDVEGKREEVWHYDLLKDIDIAVAQLQQAGVLKQHQNQVS